MRALPGIGFVTALGLAVLAGCASSAPLTDDERTTASADALSTTEDRFVTVRADERRCVAPRCGGFWLHEVNRHGRETYVSTLDLSRTGVGEETAADALRAADALVLLGRLAPAETRFGTRSFVVRGVWRGMPGVPTDRDGDVYAVARRTPPIACFVAPCPNEIATLVNTGSTRELDEVDVTPASLPWVDDAWLASRVTDHGALVIGSWARGAHFPGGYAEVLRAAQVLVRLPAQEGPCRAAPTLTCADGELATFRRTEDRCVEQVGCAPPAICPLYLPACADGYTLASWTSENACPRYACDPTFAVR